METLEVNLTELFFGKFEPPPVARTIRHKLGFVGEKPYVPTQKELRQNQPKEKRIPKSMRNILEVMKCQTKPISAAEMEQKTPWTRNHCNIILCQLFKEGLLTRYKVKGVGTRWYMYSYKGE